MDFFTRFHRQLSRTITLMLVLGLAVVLGIYWALQYVLERDLLFAVMGIAGLIFVFIMARALTRLATEPMKHVWDAVQHVSPQGGDKPAPELEKVRLGRELVSNLANSVYQLASVADSSKSEEKKQAQDIHANFVANALPLPLIVLDKEETIVYVNETAAKYFDLPQDELSGKNLYTALDLSFSSESTFTSWLKETKPKAVTADGHWDRVRIGLPGQKDTKIFDLAAHYNKANPMGYETMLVLFDHTEVYSQDDQAMSFVALAVHELRTPLTLLRGYIEVFDEELGPSLTPELKGFMQKMDASALQLSAFVDNILNVAKIEDNQLTLSLHEEKWPELLQSVINDVSLRAKVRDITIKTNIASDLPTVGVDRYSIYEVVANLLDNAIKYSRGTKEIYVTANLNDNGLVETSVKDFGLGIDGSILPHIFDKFYRNHRNRAQIGGTGLGLYLSHAIVQAHGGQISVRSKVDEGSTFTFTVLPFAKLAESGKTGDTSDVTRSAHGWIKNHSLYRD